MGRWRFLLFLAGLLCGVTAAAPGVAAQAREPMAETGVTIQRIEQTMPMVEPALWGTGLEIPLAADLQQYTVQAAQAAGIDPAILFAVMEHESGFQTDAKGYNANGTVDTGLMQINSCNWQWLAGEGIDVHTPQGNIDAAISILLIFLEKYPMEQALACYAAGEGGMKNGGGYWFSAEIMQRAEAFRPLPA